MARRTIDDTIGNGRLVTASLTARVMAVREGRDDFDSGASQQLGSAPPNAEQIRSFLH
jgi:hypothetical protein